MASTKEFARECKEASRTMRRLPADVRKTLGREVKPRVADPLAEDIKRAYTGPYAEALVAGTKTRVSADPQIVVGGARSIVRGGATARDLIFGTEWGGGKRYAVVNREREPDGKRKGRKRRGRIGRAEVERQLAAGRVIYKRHTTKQFTTKHPAVFPTIRRQMPWVLDQFGDIVEEVFDKAATNG